MTDIVTVPQSILQRLEQVQSLNAQNRRPEASAALAQVFSELARSQPELCGLLMATQLGHRQVTFQQTVTNVNSVVNDRRFLGITYGQDVKTERKITTTMRTIRFG